MRPSGPPTDEIPLWTSPDGVDRKTAQAVIDLAMRAGVAMLSTGAAAADVTGTVLMLTNAYGLRSVHVDVSYTSITLSYHRGPDADPMTVLRIVRFRVQDYTRLERLRALIVELAADPLDPGEARVRVDSVISAPHPYRRWVVTAAGGTLAAAVAALIGAGWIIIAATFISAAVISRVQDWLGRVGVASFFSQIVGSAIPTIAATLVVVAQAKGVTGLDAVSPSLIVAAGIVLLLSGLSVVGAAEDALSGYYLTAAARAFEVVVLSLGIVIGVTVVLAVGQRLGYPIAISPITRLTDDLVIQVVCAALISVAFAISAYASGRAATLAGLAGAAGWLVLGAIEDFRLGPTTASAGAALIIGFVARLLARRLDVSALAVTTAAIVPMLPGRAVYQGISQVVSEPSGAGVNVGLPTLAGAFGQGLALAAGVSLGTYFAGLLLARRLGQRLAVPAGATVPQDPLRRPERPVLSDSDTAETPILDTGVELTRREG
ncbi:MAG: threonine/serine ThrE exporter family protein [Intrasporangium sp.]|uniref:threonine/serine ThrE exporter family protein n=1 Tax=Intrasporangium sp. TaxID=1925024 RepID=UPI003F7D8344